MLFDSRREDQYGSRDHVLTVVLTLLTWGLYLCSLVLVGLAADNILFPSLGGLKWFLAVSPYMLSSVFDLIASCLRVNEVVESQDPASVEGSFCFLLFKGTLVYLGAWKLSDSSAVSAFLVLLPVFIVLGCGEFCVEYLERKYCNMRCSVICNYYYYTHHSLTKPVCRSMVFNLDHNLLRTRHNG